MPKTMDEWICEYMYYCRSRKLRPKTMNSYEQTLCLFERWLREAEGVDDVRKVTEATVRRYIVDLQQRGKYTVCVRDRSKEYNHPERRRDYREQVSDTTINNYIRNLRAFFNWLDIEGVLARNPMKKIRQLKVERKAREYLTDEEFLKLCDSMDLSYFAEHRDHTIINLLLDTGMRLGECLMITLDDLDLTNRAIKLKEENTKGRQARTVYFSKKLERLIRRWLKYKDRYCESERLFPKHDGTEINLSSFEANFRKYLKRAGIGKDISPHALRNNFAKWRVQSEFERGNSYYYFDINNREFILYCNNGSNEWSKKCNFYITGEDTFTLTNLEGFDGDFDSLHNLECTMSPDGRIISTPRACCVGSNHCFSPTTHNGYLRFIKFDDVT